MYGPGYYLVEQQLTDFLDGLDIVGFRFEPAIIWHRRINREHSTHTRLIIDRFFVSDSIGKLDLAGNQVYSMNDTYLFVSPELKERLEAIPFNYLRFSKGLSGFAGRFRATSSPS